MTFAPIGPNHLTDASKEDGITFFQFFQLANLENSFGFRVDQKLTPLGQEYTHGDQRLFHDRCFETSTSFRQMLPQNCFLAVERTGATAVNNRLCMDDFHFNSRCMDHPRTNNRAGPHGDWDRIPASASARIIAPAVLAILSQIRI